MNEIRISTAGSGPGVYVSNEARVTRAVSSGLGNSSGLRVITSPSVALGHRPSARHSFEGAHRVIDSACQIRIGPTRKILQSFVDVTRAVGRCP
jgi:hypothetical protein